VDDSSVTGKRQYVLFRLCDEEYGLPIDSVQSIIRYETPTPVPHAPEGVEGVFNLRGQVLPLIDLGRRLRGQSLVPTPSSRIIVAESGLGSVGLAVDLVHEVALLSDDEISAAPQAALAGETSEAFQGVATYGDRLVILLDPEKALPRSAFSLGIAAQGGDAGV
jgi:purine-binding chemotaxis protein CheW